MADSLTFRNQQSVKPSAVYTVTNKMSQLHILSSKVKVCIDEALSKSDDKDYLSYNLNTAKTYIENILQVLEPELNSHTAPTGNDEPEEGGLDKSDFV